MNLEWYCTDFRERVVRADGRRDGLGIVTFVQSRRPPVFLLQYLRPNRKASAPPIAEDGIKLKFCPWCGQNLLERYGSGLPFQPADSG
jgi:hypothetical protein